MINQDTQLKLVKIYLFVCDKFESELKYQCQRFTNNHSPEFSDQEIITIYLFCICSEHKYSISQMHRFTLNYYSDWFPKLPSYVAFNTRLNRLVDVFSHLLNSLINELAPASISTEISLLDSMPIITSSGKRPGKVATDLTDKSYNSTKNLYYHGIKLHALCYQNNGHMPHPESFIITKASESDLNVFKQFWGYIRNRKFYGDKIYINKEYFLNHKLMNNIEMLTPLKAIKNQPENLKQFDAAFNRIFSKAVSAIRQPIESLFNWLITKTDIQRASKVRSSNGLKIHVFGKLAAAFINLIF
jgi:hypothetical protein